MWHIEIDLETENPDVTHTDLLFLIGDAVRDSVRDNDAIKLETIRISYTKETKL